MYSVRKNHIANDAAPTVIRITFAALRVREEKIRSGISGERANRPSIATNTPSSTTPATSSAIVDPSPHPVVSVRTIPNTSSESPIVAVSAPARSKPFARSGLRPSATNRWVGERREQPDRDVDEQDPAPRQRLDDDAAEQRAGGAAGAAHRAPDPDRAIALGRIGEGGREDRQRCGCDHRAAEALGRARDDQQRLTVRQAAGQRREREQRQARDEHDPPAEQVGGAAAEQQEARERHRIGVHDPLQVGLGEAERVPDRRQRDVHDGDVEDHHELRDATQNQRRRQVRAGGWRLRGGCRNRCAHQSSCSRVLIGIKLLLLC